MSNRFSQWAAKTALISGYWETFTLMTLVCVIWAVSGPLFGFSDTWQLVINTATTVLTFLMVFLIQNTQNRDSVAIHLKLDELLSSIDEADNEIMLAEHATDDELDALKEKYRQLCEQVESRLGSAQVTS
jgi:low affinity Fe/Cu permease